MNNLSLVDEAQKLVRDTVLSSRGRGRTIKEARAEAAEILGLTHSRIWTFLYRPYLLKKISENELQKIQWGFLGVLTLEVEAYDEQRENIVALKAARLAGDDRLTTPDRSKKTTPWGRPLWEYQRGPSKRPRKNRYRRRSTGC